MGDIYTLHRRRKLFNIGGGGGANPARPSSILEGGGGGGLLPKYIYACMHMYARTCVKYSYTYACTAYANIHFTSCRLKDMKKY